MHLSVGRQPDPPTRAVFRHLQSGPPNMQSPNGDEDDIADEMELSDVPDMEGGGWEQVGLSVSAR